MMIIQDMVERLGKLDATNQSVEASIADFILNELNYKGGRKAQAQKKFFVKVVIQAYAKMLQDAGVKVEDYKI